MTLKRPAARATSLSSRPSKASKQAEVAKQPQVPQTPPAPQTPQAPSEVLPAEPKVDGQKEKMLEVASQLSKTDTLAQKLELLKTEDSLSAQEKLKLMQENLSSKDWNALNGRVQTARAKNEALDQAAREVRKPDYRTLVGSYILDPTMSDVYQSLTMKVSSSQKVSKKEKWVSWTKLCQEWSEEEISLHLDSGRITAKECPDTPGVWVYCDQNNVKVEKELNRSKDLTKTGQEQMKPETKDQDDQDWDASWNAYGSATSFGDLSVFGSGTLKGSGKKGQHYLKGKGKGRGKGGKAALADVDPQEAVEPKKLNLLKGQLTKMVGKLGCLGMSTEEADLKTKVSSAFAECQAFQEELAGKDWTNEAFAAFSKDVISKLGNMKKEFSFRAACCTS